MNSFVRARLQPIRVVAAVALVILSQTACKRHKAEAQVDAPPAIVLTENSAGLLLTWIDEKGDFHIEEKVADVPLVGRDAVRVMDPSKDESGKGATVVVADLRTARADGTYALQTMTREAFDKLALERRNKFGSTLANGGAVTGNGRTQNEGASPNSNGGAGATGAGEPKAADSEPTVVGRPAVIIYGASWCGACHEAAAYLKKKGIAYIEKDIEADRGANHEMQAKLAKAGMRGGSIPVLDVRGKVMIGFNPQAVEDALGSAL